MVVGSPSSASAAKLVFWSGGDPETPSSGTADAPSSQQTRPEEAEIPKSEDGRESMYVRVFNGTYALVPRGWNNLIYLSLTRRDAQGGDFGRKEIVLTDGTILFHGLA